ncbi:TIGR00725 family protein [Actinomadura madurae]|uniref:TIGR00725 family protein n=1 Tax=Actinomadura madurae TaxID=1993 RepID=UPI0020D22CEC|nr:TIGR00725 family protein [Actinomadura madurae]MCP9976891.1 TIGR00725 family protein [Actinomadura madurae]
MAVQVAVCGPGECTEREWDHAYETGRILAEHGAVVVCGGHGGVMAAVAAGARTAGGTVVGVLPAADRAAAGPDLTVAVPTGLGQARNNVIVNAADALIAVGGSWGRCRRSPWPCAPAGSPWCSSADGASTTRTGGPRAASCTPPTRPPPSRPPACSAGRPGARTRASGRRSRRPRRSTGR